MRKYNLVHAPKCVHERRNSNQIGFLWQIITLILNRQHFSQAEAVAPAVIRARLVSLLRCWDVTTSGPVGKVGGQISTGVKLGGTFAFVWGRWLYEIKVLLSGCYFLLGNELKLYAWSEVEHSVFASIQLRHIFSTSHQLVMLRRAELLTVIQL